MPVTAEKPIHASKFHIHAVGGTCPVCYIADAASWEDLLFRIDEARNIVTRTLDVESDLVLGKVKSAARI